MHARAVSTGCTAEAHWRTILSSGPTGTNFSALWLSSTCSTSKMTAVANVAGDEAHRLGHEPRSSDVGKAAIRWPTTSLC